MMERHLVQEGCRVVTATGGVEALRLARELRPVAITLDVPMPDLDGLTVLAGRDEHGLGDDDRRRLSGGVERVIRKRGAPADEFLREVADALAACLERRPA